MSNTLKETLARIDNYIAEQKLNLERGQMLEDLMKNPMFQEVIIDGYINVRTQELFDILTNPNGASPYSREEILRRLDAINDFKGYVGTEITLGTVRLKAQQAPDNIQRELVERASQTAEAAMEKN